MIINNFYGFNIRVRDPRFSQLSLCQDRNDKEAGFEQNSVDVLVALATAAVDDKRLRGIILSP